jgi:hypothetical protein
MKKKNEISITIDNCGQCSYHAIIFDYSLAKGTHAACTKANKEVCKGYNENPPIPDWCPILQIQIIERSKHK